MMISGEQDEIPDPIAKNPQRKLFKRNGIFNKLFAEKKIEMREFLKSFKFILG